MNFLDKNGLNHLWTKIKASFSAAIVENSQNSRIPFVANHQIVSLNETSSNINIYDWFQKASKGGILELVFAGAQGGTIYCTQNNISFMYQMRGSSHGPTLINIGNLEMSYNYYARLIKMEDDKLVVAEFVQNK